MKKFIVNISIFSFFLAILAVISDLAISYILKNLNEYPGEYEVMNDIYAGEATSDLLIYGSSRAWIHFDPKILSSSLHLSTYNLGIDGHNFWLQYLRHLEYLKYNEKPKKILLSLDISSLTKRKELYEQNQFLPYMFWSREVQYYTSSYIGYSKMDYYIPLARYFGKKSVIKSVFMQLVNGNEETFRDRGYRGVDRQWNVKLEKVRSTKEPYYIRIDQPTLDLLEKFISECQSLNIELVFVYSPEYLEGQRVVTNREKIMELYRDLAKKYDLLFLDYSKSEIGRHKSNFYDASHLNSKGSNLFTKVLSNDLSNDGTVSSSSID